MAHRLSAEAEDDLDDIWLYIARESDSPDRADRQIKALTDRFHLLGDHPLLGRSRPDLRSDLRSFPVGSYLIVYGVDQRDVTILRVFPGMMDIASFFPE